MDASPLPHDADPLDAVAPWTGVVRATLLGAFAWALALGAWLLA